MQEQVNKPRTQNSIIAHSLGTEAMRKGTNADQGAVNEAMKALRGE
jgi:hypothetical protein